MWKPDICIHHFPCDDGFASAWVARRAWPGITIKGTNYGLPFPDVDVTGKNILIADFSYKSDVLGDVMRRGARSIVMLDHHKTAQADLAAFNVETRPPVTFCAQDVDGFLRDYADLGRPPVLAHFDMERSGAALTWEFCNPGFEPPPLIALIEDRDLWRFKLPNSRAFSLFLKSFDYDFAEWDYIAKRFQGDGPQLLREAAAIERFYDRKIAEILPTASLKTIGKWKDVPTVSAPYAFASDVAHQLLKAHPAAPFAAVIVDSYGARTYSLRSADDREDVSEVAKSFGGGGHRNAAGFRVPI